MLNMGEIVHVRIKDMQQNELTEIIYISTWINLKTTM